ncbi:hypothetical protein [Salinarimonas rosea]|uniref:hypothetical protein n=1 Tax=Salinarimonas rosea TaxID=552063 RepID=UPI0012EB2D3C|nr:hypothetical protein [Salinarimonas rosea]
MTQEVYYIAAAFIASVSLLISAVNMSVILRDRRRRPILQLVFAEAQAKVNRVLLLDENIGRDKKSYFRPALLITNRCSVTQTVVAVRARGALFAILRDNIQRTISGQFHPDEKLQAIKPGEVCLFTFNTRELNLERDKYLEVIFADGKKMHVPIRPLKLYLSDDGITQ